MDPRRSVKVGSPKTGLYVTVCVCVCSLQVFPSMRVCTMHVYTCLCAGVCASMGAWLRLDAVSPLVLQRRAAFYQSPVGGPEGTDPRSVFMASVPSQGNRYVTLTQMSPWI